MPSEMEMQTEEVSDLIPSIRELLARNETPSRVLKAMTRSAHDGTEAASPLSHLTEGTLRADEYIDILTRFYGLHRYWEGFALKFFATTPIAGLLTHSRASDIEDDLRIIGVVPVMREDSHDFTEELSSTAAAIGALYVVEGSTLGGAVIARQLLRSYGEAVPTNFFRSHGEDRGRHWRDVVAAIDSTLTSVELVYEAVTGALHTFAAFNRAFT